MNNKFIQRILRGFGANLYGQGVVILIQIAGVPILLYYWGVTLYGEWLILFAIPAYLTITNLGFSISAANDMTARAARGDTKGVLVVFQSLITLVYSVAIVSLLVVSLLVFTLPLGDWLNISNLSADETSWVLWFLAFAVLVNLAEGVNHAGFRAHGDYALHVAINYNTMLAQYATVWILAALGQGPVAAAAGFAVVRCLVTPAVGILLVRRHRRLAFGREHARLSALRSLVRPAIANVSVPLAQAINIQGMVIVVGAMLGPPAVVVFSTLRTLSRLAVSTVLAVSHALEPEMATAWGGGNKKLLQRLYVRGMITSFWLAVGITLSLFLIGDWILSIWTHGRVAMDRVLFNWLLLSALASVLWYSGLNVLKSANRHLRAALLYVISSLLAVVVAILFIHFTGRLSNAGLALLIMDALMAFYLLVAASLITNIAARRVLLKLFDPRPLLNGLPWRKPNAS